MVAALSERLSVEASQGAAGLEAIADDWRRLAAGPRQRFFHWHAWWRAWLLHLEPEPESVALFVARRGTEPVAILPLVRAEGDFGLGARAWELPRHPHLPLADFPRRDDLDLAEFFAALGPALARATGADWDGIRFEPVLAESRLAALSAPRHGAVHRAVVKTCDEIETSAGEDFRARLSANFRSNLNKARNKLSREPYVEFAIETRPLELAAALADFTELEASGWKGQGGTATAIRLEPRLRAFYHGLTADLAPEGRVVVCTLRVAGRLIAGQFCLRDVDTLYVLKLAYDEEWSRVAPGNMLLEHLVRNGHDVLGVARINLVGDPRWFKDWRPSGQDVYRIWLTNGTVRGRALAGLLGLKERLRPVYRRVSALAGRTPSVRSRPAG